MNNKYYQFTGLISQLILLQVMGSAQQGLPISGFDSLSLEIKAASRAITSMDLLTIRDVIGVQISPDGKSVAYVVSQAVYDTNSYRSALYITASAPGGEIVNLGSAGPPHWDRLGQYIKVHPQWSPDNKYITHLMGQKDEKQIWLWHREGGPPVQLTHSADDIESYEWRPNGKHIIYTTIDPITADEIKQVAERGILYDSYAGEGIEGSIAPWRGGDIARAVIATKPRRRQVWVYDLTTRTERKATIEEEMRYNKAHLPRPVYQPGDKMYTHLIQISPDQKLLAYVSYQLDGEKAKHRVWSISIKESADSPPIHTMQMSASYIQKLWWSQDSRTIYFACDIEEREVGIYSIQAQGGAIRELTRRNDFLTQLSIDESGSRIACLREDTTRLPEVAVFDLRDGALKTVANVNPEFKDIALSPATRLEWTNRYGDKASGYLVKPLNYKPGKRYPLIVTTYGTRGFLRGAVGDEYPIQVFAANGFVVLDFYAPPERVSKTGDFDAVKLRWYSPMSSLEAVIKMLDEMGVIDVNRKGLTGLSYGAEITNFTITHSDLFQAAAASSDSARDPIFFYLANSFWHTRFKEWGLGLPSAETAARWQELSPALNATRVKAPLLMQVADSEYLNGLQFYTALRENGKPIEMIIYANEQHLKNQPKHRYEVYQRNLDWFKFWLQDREDTDPSKQGQYIRWRMLRGVARSQHSTVIR